jgi:NADH-quinone oxidoreductase subunit F
MTTKRFLLPDSPIHTMHAYIVSGGGKGLETARRMGWQDTIAEIAASGLRGRGGAGFSTATKWASVRSGEDGTRYVVANGAEGEPASFKDRMLIRNDPFRILEGAAIAALAVGATNIYLATKRSYNREVETLSGAALEFSESGLVDDLIFTVVEGPDEYLFGEEKALLEVIEGRDPMPRMVPPWQVGLFAKGPVGGWEASSTGPNSSVPTANPTVVNNVETLATVAHILERGATWFRSMGTSKSPGNIIATVVGDVCRPGVHEVEFGTPFSELLALCGGPVAGRSFKAAFSGVSNPVLTADRFDTPLTYEDFAAAGSGFGAGGFVVYDDSVDMTAVAAELSRFLSVESCGQCPACKRETLSITERLRAIEHGTGSDDDLESISASLRKVTDANRCYIGAEEQNVVSSILRAYPDDFVERIETGSASPSRILVPLIKDIDDAGHITFDERHSNKRPDWTYGPAPTP